MVQPLWELLGSKGFFFWTGNCKHVIHLAPFSVTFNNYFCKSLHWVGSAGASVGRARAALCCMQPTLHRAGLSPAAKRGHPWERALEVVQKNTAQAEDGRGEKWAAVTSTPSWKQEEGEEVLPEPRFLAAPGGIHSSKQAFPNRTLSLWKTHTGFIPKALSSWRGARLKQGQEQQSPQQLLQTDHHSLRRRQRRQEWRCEEIGREGGVLQFLTLFLTMQF